MEVWPPKHGFGHLSLLASTTPRSCELHPSFLSQLLRAVLLLHWLQTPPGFSARASSLHPAPATDPPVWLRPLRGDGDEGRRGTSLRLAGCGAAYVPGSAPCLLFIRFLRVNLCFHRCPSVSFSSSLPSLRSALAGAGGAWGPCPQQLQVTPGGVVVWGGGRHFTSLCRSCMAGCLPGDFFGGEPGLDAPKAEMHSASAVPSTHH